MTKPIKFRGRDKETGKIVYAELGEIMKTPDPGYLTFVPCEAYYVDKDSIAQLVGYDKDGNEIYEGDIVVGNYDKREWQAKIIHSFQIPDIDGVVRLYETANFTLKEEQHETTD